MDLAIKQDSEYLGHNRWRWSVWLEGPATQLDRIDHVRWVLHRTFINPVRDVSDRTTNFRLETDGWGTFKIFARAFLKDGYEVPLEHELEFTQADAPVR